VASDRKGSNARPPRKRSVNVKGGTSRGASRGGMDISALSGTFIKSMLPDADRNLPPDGADKRQKGDVAVTFSSVSALRRLAVVLIVAVFVIALALGVWSGVHAGGHVSSGSASAQTAQSGKTAKKNARQSVRRRQAQARAKALIPTKFPPLTDANRADILAKAQGVVAASGKQPHQYSYCVSSRGAVKETDLGVFENTIFRTLNDPRGWPRAGATFAHGTDPASCDFVMYLAQASTLTSFSADCSDEYSCRVDNDVIINEDRWNGATKRMLDSGVNIDAYRQMVVNHEVGHRLGHFDNEPSCSAPGRPAPLMQEQSIDLRGCVPNSWPLDEELWIG
jgi:predicted metalloprotease